MKKKHIPPFIFNPSPLSLFFPRLTLGSPTALKKRWSRAGLSTDTEEAVTCTDAAA
jgi:hypothetical protein